MTANFRPAPGQIPTDPGVYRFRDGDGRVIYVGKAKNLRARLTSYFQDPAALHQRTQTMVATARSLDWVVVATEVEALTLEYAWIKEFDPRFNVRYRDDKSYPFLAVTVGEEFPRAMVMRGEKRPGVRYFGPFAHAWAIRETVDQLLRVFPMRTCTRGVFRRAQASGRPCLLGYIDKCAAPCTGEVTAEEHRAIVEDFCAFMAGDSAAFVRSRTEQMNAAAAELDYERAARLRDDLYALQRVLERNAVVLPDGTDADVVGLASDELEACVRVFHVRDGRIRGERGFIVERVDDADEAQLVATLLAQMYAEPDADVPRRVLVPALPEPGEVEVLTDWLGQQRGGPVGVSVPRRGRQAGPDGDRDPQRLAVAGRAQAAALRGPHDPQPGADRARRRPGPADGAAADRVLRRLQPRRRRRRGVHGRLRGRPAPALGVPEVRDQGLRRAERRRGHLRGDRSPLPPAGTRGGCATGRRPSDGPRRRGRRHDRRDRRSPRRWARHPAPTRPGRSASRRHLPPGSRTRRRWSSSTAAHRRSTPRSRRCVDLGLTDIAVVGLAKRLEEVWLPDEEDPVILPRTSQGLYLLQRVRDEAHRTAIRYQRQKRSARMTTSALDDIPGLGPARRKALLSRFGSVRKLRAATPEMIAEVPGIGPALAERIILALSGETISAVNLTTGEILGDDVPVTEEPR